MSSAAALAAPAVPLRDLARWLWLWHRISDAAFCNFGGRCHTCHTFEGRHPEWFLLRSRLLRGARGRFTFATTPAVTTASAAASTAGPPREDSLVDDAPVLKPSLKAAFTVRQTSGGQHRTQGYEEVVREERDVNYRGQKANEAPIAAF